MRPRPATRAASFVNFPSCRSAAEAAERRHRHAATANGALCRQAANHNPGIEIPAPSSHNLRNASRPTMLKSKSEEEAATPGRPARAHARFRVAPGDSPSGTTGYCWLCCSSGRPESFTFSLSHTLGQNLSSGNRKTSPRCEEAVDDETSLWNVEEIRARTACAADSRYTHPPLECPR